MKHFAFTGTKNGCTEPQESRLWDIFAILKHDGFQFMHNGDCVGADVDAAYIWHQIGGDIILHPPTNPKYRAYLDRRLSVHNVMPEGDYMKRDHDMVDLSSYLVGASKTPYEYLRSGTWATIRYARKIGIERRIIYPDGHDYIEPATGLAGLIG